MAIFFHPSPQFNVDNCQLREAEEAVNVPANVSGIAVRVSLAILDFCVRAFVVETKLPVALFQLGTSKL